MLTVEKLLNRLRLESCQITPSRREGQWEPKASATVIGWVLPMSSMAWVALFLPTSSAALVCWQNWLRWKKHYGRAVQRPSRLTAKVTECPPVSCNSAQMHWRPSRPRQLQPSNPCFGIVTVFILSARAGWIQTRHLVLRSIKIKLMAMPISLCKHWAHQRYTCDLFSQKGP